MNYNYNYHVSEDDTILPKTNYNSPFYSSVPITSHPTDVLSKRFELWRQIIKSLINYFKSIAIANQQYSKINDNLIQTINFPFFTNIFPKVNNPNKQANNKIYEPGAEDLKKQTYFSEFGNGSIQDVQILLKKYHLNLGEQQRTIALELMNVLVPRLEELQKDLFVKIREIKNLHTDFKNNLNEEIAITGQCLEDYVDRVKKIMKDGKVDDVSAKKDPYLLRLKLEIQLKQQLYQENYLEEAFINLQITGLELEKIIYQEIQNSLNRYNELISQEIFVMYNDLINELHQGLISKENYFEWDRFITRDNSVGSDSNKRHFLNIKHNDELPIPRKLSSVKYPYSKNVVSKCFRSGELLKKSKLLKNYSKSFFILTINYLHEFKSSNLMENFTPVHSIRLDDCILTESNEMKFTLHVKTIGLDSKVKTQNFVFKRIPSEMDEPTFKKWIGDLRTMTSFNSFNERYRFINGRLSNSNSRSNTPMIEVSNPMDDIGKINEKLQSLQITSITNEASAEHNGGDAAPVVSSSPLSESSSGSQSPNANVTTSSEFAQNIPQPTLANFQPKLPKPKQKDTTTKPMPKLTIPIPKVQVQEPSPIAPSQNLSNGDLFKLAVQHNQRGQGAGSNSNAASTPVATQGAGVTGRTSPPVSNIANNNYSYASSITAPSIASSSGSSSISAIGPTANIKRQTSHIDLNGSLYKDQHDEDLNKVLDALKSE